MNLHGLPSVEHLLQTQLAAELIATYGRSSTLKAIRAVLDETRAYSMANESLTLPGREHILTDAAALLEGWASPTLVPVINASGVILHTNLGRAPLSTAAIKAIEAVSHGYSNLEFDLETGKRGSRLFHSEALLKRITGAEAAIIVNNNAAAMLLVLAALAKRRRVVISRSQMVEIGGEFRVPEVMKQSGARLVEVGATNKVRLADYEEALVEPTAILLHVHRSNFKMIGFTEEPEWKDIVAVAHNHGVTYVDDLGSGTLLDTARYGLAHEPTVQESLASGADLVCFSGDKLLGGPQAGIIIGKSELIDLIKKHPLAHAFRRGQALPGCPIGHLTPLSQRRGRAGNSDLAYDGIDARPGPPDCRRMGEKTRPGRGHTRKIDYRRGQFTRRESPDLPACIGWKKSGSVP